MVLQFIAIGYSIHAFVDICIVGILSHDIAIVKISYHICLKPDVICTLLDTY